QRDGAPDGAAAGEAGGVDAEPAQRRWRRRRGQDHQRGALREAGEGGFDADHDRGGRGAAGGAAALVRRAARRHGEAAGGRAGGDGHAGWGGCPDPPPGGGREVAPGPRAGGVSGGGRGRVVATEGAGLRVTVPVTVLPAATGLGLSVNPVRVSWGPAVVPGVAGVQPASAAEAELKPSPTLSTQVAEVKGWTWTLKAPL